MPLVRGRGRGRVRGGGRVNPHPKPKSKPDPYPIPNLALGEHDLLDALAAWEGEVSSGRVRGQG